MTDELKPCPFCKSKRLVVKSMFASFVRCLDCNATGPEGLSNREAADKWNKRAEPEKKSAEQKNKNKASEK